MSSRRLLVTAGPSREHLDDVRFLSNASSGRMGIAVANAAAAQGWAVDLALGPVPRPAPIDDRVQVHPFTAAQELDELCRELWPGIDAFVATAAVCDFRAAERIPGKKKKSGDRWELSLVRTPDVLLNRSAEKGGRTLVGFALEATVDESEARRKLEAKDLDLILLNTTPNLGSSAGDYYWLERGGTVDAMPSASKEEVGERIAVWLTARSAV